MQRFILTVEDGAALNDVEEIELMRLPEEGEPIETHLGTCIVTSAEPAAPESQYAGRIVCRLP